jgi:hypothetical protein
MTPDTQLLEATVRMLTDDLDALVGACLKDGQIVAPDRAALMRARAMLPPRCKHSLQKPPKAP